jgi:hypothetical protein
MLQGQPRQFQLRNGNELLEQVGLLLRAQAIKVTDGDIQKLSQVTYVRFTKVWRVNILLKQGTHVSNPL